jgi:hypothetical protein
VPGVSAIHDAINGTRPKIDGIFRDVAHPGLPSIQNCAEIRSGRV